MHFVCAFHPQSAFKINYVVNSIKQTMTRLDFLVCHVTNSHCLYDYILSTNTHPLDHVRNYYIEL